MATNGHGSGSTVGAVAGWADDRLNLSGLGRKYVRKVFPDHWSFMLGEIAMWSFVVLLVTGVMLSLWFTPSMDETTYEGSYAQLRGVPMSSAYSSTLHLSFDVRGGLLLRQTHHWAAMVFIAGMLVHLIRVFVTGAFRKPREVTFVIGGTMLLLGVLEGFIGYSLPDDLLSGTGLRIADGIIKATPVVGTYFSFLLFGGEFPGGDVISRFYIIHVLLIPGLLLALMAAHLLLIVYHKHTQWAGPGRTERNVVGYPFLPVYLAKTTGFFLVVFGTLTFMGALLTINPIWKYGPYDPAKVTAGSQPDWYMGIAEGLLRIMPGWETHVAGHTISWNVLLPGQVFALVPFLLVIAWPFLEAWVTGDKREHHVLQRPRDVPTRTAFMAALIAAYGLLWMAGGNDILATRFHLSLNGITETMRVAIFVVPVLVFVVTRRWCIGLQRADNDRLEHGEATGVIVRSPEGGYSEKHQPVAADRAVRVRHRAANPVLTTPPDTDSAGVPVPHRASARARARLSQLMYADEQPLPDVDEPAPALEGGHDERRD
ncbi:MAG TPA: ubiquinol-cytochrome c reductase cytochrome b subunit [Nocardioides sp.]|uniref:cytochrome bc1 complex cytochrome b subunit n=1 Tax=Nocardioides sp. TaxID=35761 RepID=UPI002E3267FE|nr:ubiquinol-cytochrome c reductase cytochrome b subunit [Nocardioides sp.]HEX5089192.1 ubiquinol-cytochrome c reductase cytochrome b subunit [Nocardioides sp.]